MEKLNVTPGNWYVGALRKNVYSNQKYDFNVSICTESEPDVDNLILIADAGTTYNQCGLLPSELLKQRNELLDALKNAYYQLDILTSGQNNTFDNRFKCFTENMPKIKQAIQNAENS